MKKSILAVALGVLVFATAGIAEAGRYRRGGGNFWGGFAAGAVTGALAGAWARPPVVVGPPVPVVVAPPPPAYVRPARVWIPGAYVVKYRPCGTPYRVWRPGHYRRPY